MEEDGVTELNPEDGTAERRYNMFHCKVKYCLKRYVNHCTLSQLFQNGTMWWTARMSSVCCFYSWREAPTILSTDKQIRKIKSMDSYILIAGNIWCVAFSWNETCELNNKKNIKQKCHLLWYFSVEQLLKFAEEAEYLAQLTKINCSANC